MSELMFPGKGKSAKMLQELNAAESVPAPPDAAGTPAEASPAPPSKGQKKDMSKGLSNHSSGGTMDQQEGGTGAQSGAEALPLAKDTMLELMKKQPETEPTVRLNLDVKQSMHKRIKMFCVAHDVKSIKEMVTVVLDDYLKQHGF